ncbi:MAG: alpha/beta fold hydrolase, partial [Gammaproteobacteria bacterium]|nr:alpha/beta fold hydrolase [Gammaproteobacteria bacterium]
MPVLQQVLTVLGLSYLAACLVLFFIQDAILFYPSEAKNKLRAPYEEFELPVASGRKIVSRGYIVNEDAEGPVVVFFTGNLGEARTYVDRFATFGVPVVLTNYRGFGKSDGTPTEKTMVRDAKLQVEWVRSEFPNRQLVLMGNSMGTGIAILASDENVQG